LFIILNFIINKPTYVIGVVVLVKAEPQNQALKPALSLWGGDKFQMPPDGSWPCRLRKAVQRQSSETEPQKRALAFMPQGNTGEKIAAHTKIFTSKQASPVIFIVLNYTPTTKIVTYNDAM